MTKSWKSLDEFTSPHEPNKRPDDAVIYTVNTGGRDKQVLIKLGPAIAAKAGMVAGDRVTLRWCAKEAEILKVPTGMRTLRQAKRWLILGFAYKEEMQLPAVSATTCDVVRASKGAVTFKLPRP